MTGTIVALVPTRRTGVIRAEDGSRVLFAAAVVLGDFDTLAIGHRVNYDLDRVGPSHNAARVLREPLRPSAPRKLDSPPDLRYRGFDQAQSIRSYRFDAVGAGVAVQQFVITVDLTLLLKHHVGVQEVPVLCLRKLAADLKGSPESQKHELGNDDLLAYASSRAEEVQRRKKPKQLPAGRRGPPPPGLWKH